MSADNPQPATAQSSGIVVNRAFRCEKVYPCTDTMQQVILAGYSDDNAEPLTITCPSVRKFEAGKVYSVAIVEYQPIS